MFTLDQKASFLPDPYCRAAPHCNYRTRQGQRPSDVKWLSQTSMYPFSHPLFVSPHPRERKLIFHEDVAVTTVVISTPSPPGNISVSIVNTMDRIGGPLHPSRQDFNNTPTTLCMWVQSLLGRPDNIVPPPPTSVTQLPLGVASLWPRPAELNLIFAAHKFTEYYKNECNAGKDGGELINIWQW
jgi:hypothetical protein